MFHQEAACDLEIIALPDQRPRFRDALLQGFIAHILTSSLARVAPPARPVSGEPISVFFGLLFFDAEYDRIFLDGVGHGTGQQGFDSSLLFSLK